MSMTKQELERLVELEAERSLLRQKLTETVKAVFESDTQAFTHKHYACFVRVGDVSSDGTIEVRYSKDGNPKDEYPEYTSMSWHDVCDNWDWGAEDE